MANYKFDLTKSLSQLNKNLVPNGDASSRLVKRHNELLVKPIKDFSIEDLRLMIGQNTGLPYLIPVAMEQLRENILAEGDYYEGDLLKAVLTSDRGFWEKRTALRQQMLEIIKDQLAYLLDYPMNDQAKIEMVEAYQQFRAAAHALSGSHI